jgi:acetyl-CoA synthetase
MFNFIKSKLLQWFSFDTISQATREFLSVRNLLQRYQTDHNSACQLYHPLQLSHFNWAIDYFDHMARDSEKIGLWVVNEYEETRVSFDTLYRRSNQVANFLRQHDLQPQDKVLIMLPNCLALWETRLAIMKAGGVFLPVAVLLTTDELAYRIHAAKIKIVITTCELAEKFDALSSSFIKIVVDKPRPGWINYNESEFQSDVFKPQYITAITDPCVMFFTSGTTAKPKMVIHTHQYPIAHLSTMYWLGLRDTDLHLNIASPGWAKHDWSSFFATWNAGACVFASGHENFDISKLLELLQQYPITSLCATPVVWRGLRQEKLALYQPRLRLRSVLSAGEPLNPEIIHEVQRTWGLTIREGYGQTETTAVMGYTTNQTLIPGTMGYPLPGYQIALEDSYGNESNEGELIIKATPIGVPADYADFEKNQSVLASDSYHTGDVLRRVGNTYIFVGRTDDLFKSAGYRISPFELESVVVKHPAVLEAAVVPKAASIEGSVPKAYVTLRSNFQPSEQLAQDIIHFTAKRVAPSHQIRAVEFCSALPKTLSGKIRRVELRAREAEEMSWSTNDQYS